ncbi:MAG: GHMP kinase [Clostridia bacterium]|nr:GHMP kinase [Clostridia bacterium]
MRARVRVPGTCGELVQGTLAGVNFHVTCPISFFAELSVEINKDDPEIIYPQGFEKAAGAVAATMKLLGLDTWGAVVEVYQTLPGGKGMASSTADITAACYAAALAAGRTLQPGQVAGIALAIEPSDGIMYPGIRLFDHLRGLINEDLGHVQGLGVLMIDPGGGVDTLTFNAREDLAEANKAKEKLTGEALKLVREGLHKGNLALIGRGATLSSRANQRILPKKELFQLEEMVESLGLLGINVAHSGTVMGLLFEMEQVDGVQLEEEVRHQLGSGFNYYLTTVTGGGPRVVEISKGEKPWKKSNMSTGAILEPPLRSLG